VCFTRPVKATGIDRSVTYVSGMDQKRLEAPPGFEPAVEVLQSEREQHSVRDLCVILNESLNLTGPAFRAAQETRSAY
jgi:hypothetical protein